MSWHTLFRRKRFWFSCIVLAAAVAGGVWFVGDSKESVQFKVVAVGRGRITATVSSSGTINPVISVQVGSQVSGQIKELYVDFNSEVTKGQLIARIDPETFEYRVRQGEADVNSARAQVQSARAEEARQKVNLANAKIDMERRLKLVDRGFLSPSERDTVTSVYEAQVQAVNVAHAGVNNALATVKQREAALEQAKVDLERTMIRSPVNGTIIKKTVEAGQTVAASLQAPELFVIAEDLTDMQVETAIDESEIGRIRVGQKTTFTVDSYPGRTFEGEVRQIRLAAQNVSNVITYVVIVSAPNPKKALLPGMTANVRIVLDERENVRLIPNAALRFRPPSGVAAPTAQPATDAQKRASREGALKATLARYTSELGLDAEQKNRAEAILTAMRHSIAEMHTRPEQDRKKAIEAIRADMQQKMAEILNAEQKKKWAALLQAESDRRDTLTTGRIYIQNESGQPQEMSVRIGVSDGAMTELVGANPPEGTAVIVGVLPNASAGKGASAPQGRLPMFR
ncbi:MAG: efflux RND transporter periplasmic adaptor subunit [Burkholderiaceae bacterium]|jgi:HlyD family secretion protein|nr:efflux RND transporter periplasmic adaptor subunit [Burkholderiaceae bacterium]